jgi:mono/diheme cytochrome c family protein
LLAIAVLLCALSIPAAMPARAQGSGDADNGHRLAQAWCANCHTLDSSHPTTATGAPSFSAIAANKAITATSLHVFLRTPHDRMPDLSLSNNEVDDLITYILAPRRR